jgi:hypothetical protein
MKLTRKPSDGIIAFLLPILIIAVISFALYANTLVNDFVYDDSAQVGKNPWIRDIRYLPDIFTSSVWGFESGSVTSNYYRPMMNVMFMITYIFGLKPWGFHLVNILFHVGNSVLVFMIATKLRSAPEIGVDAAREVKEQAQGPLLPIFHDSRFTIHDFPFITALLFAHPIHVESVAWCPHCLSFLLAYFACSPYFFIST